MNDLLRAAIRAHTEPASWTTLDSTPSGLRWEAPDIEYDLSFDIETTTDQAQGLLIGCYRIDRIDWTTGVPGSVCLEEGLIRPDDGPGWSRKHQRLLRRYVETHPSSVDPLALLPGADDPGRAGLRVVTATEFVWHILQPAMEARVTIVAFGATFDFSRIAERAYPSQDTYRGGETLELAHYLMKDGRRKPKVWLKAKRAGPRRFLLDLKAVSGHGKEQHGITGRLLDLQALIFALADRNYRLDDAAKAYELPVRKLRHPRLGILSAALMAYCRRDVEVTQHLYLAAMTDFRRHPIGLDPVSALSPATMARWYLREMGIRPPLVRWPEWDRGMFGWCMASYCGGRCECLIRRTSVPVVVLDIRSTYPTCCVLLGIQALLIAEWIDVREATEDVRDLLQELGRDDLFDPATWRRLSGIAEIDPDDDLLPVRAHYSGGQTWEMGQVRATSDQPMWVALPDLVASKIRTGRAPRIRRAFLFEPVGITPGLRSVLLRSEVELDPRRMDVFARVVEERERARQLKTVEGDRLAQAAKTYGNSWGYGIYIEYRPQVLAEGEVERVVIYGRGDEPFIRERVTSPEDPGPSYFPPIGTLVPAGARLLLALAETEIQARGGTHAYMDTDSIFVVASRLGGLVGCEGGRERLPDGNPAIRALSWQVVDEIVERFAALNPYDPEVVPGSILKVEKENFDERGEQHELLFYGTSSKRYNLHVLDSAGRPVIIKGSDHGLGHLLDPTRGIDDDPDDEEAAERFNHELWHYVLGRDLGLPFDEPAWLDLPAVGRTSLSTPGAMEAYEAYNAGKSYQESVKPFGFGLTCYVHPLGYPLGADPAHFHLVAPFERDARRWRELEWFDLETGRLYAIRTGNPAFAAGDVVTVKSYRDVLEDFRGHPEAKLSAPDGTLCGKETRGLLRRRHVTISGFTHIGKEARDLDRRGEGTVHDLDAVQNDYGDGGVDIQRPLRRVLAQLTPMERASIATAAGVHPRTAERLIGPTGGRLRDDNLREITHATAVVLRRRARRQGHRLPGDDHDCLVAWLTAHPGIDAHPGTTHN
jgi:hypothetical protein